MPDSIMTFLSSLGPLGMFIHAFIDAIIFPIPAFFLQVSLSLLNPSTALMLATVGFIGCLAGTPIGYWIGRRLGPPVLNRFAKPDLVDKATRMFRKNGEAAIMIGAFTPIPFKVFTILSGCLQFPLWRLIVFAAIGRAAKFYAVGGLFYAYGQAAENMIHGWLTYALLGAAVLIGGGWYLAKRLRGRKKYRSADRQTVMQPQLQQREHADG